MFHMNIFIIKGEREILFFFGKVSLISDRTLYIYISIYLSIYLSLIKTLIDKNGKKERLIDR